MLDNVMTLTSISGIMGQGADIPNLEKVGKIDNRVAMGMPLGRPDPKRLSEPDKSEEKISKAEAKRNKRKLRNIALREIETRINERKLRFSRYTALREKDKNHG